MIQKRRNLMKKPSKCVSHFQWLDVLGEIYCSTGFLHCKMSFPRPSIPLLNEVHSRPFKSFKTCKEISWTTTLFRGSNLNARGKTLYL